MFDMGFTEMMLIGIVALVVIGPERLPGVARTAGKYFSRLRNFMTNVRADVESELKADELREIFESQKDELQSLKDVVGDAGKDVGMSDITNEISGIASSVEDNNPASSPEPRAKKKSATKAKPSAKTKSRAKSGAVPKTVPKPKSREKLKSKARPKAQPKPKAKPRAKVAKPAKVKAK